MSSEPAKSNRCFKKEIFKALNVEALPRQHVLVKVIVISEYLNWLHEIESPPPNVAIWIFHLECDAILRLGLTAQVKASSFQSLSKKHKKSNKSVYAWFN